MGSCFRGSLTGRAAEIAIHQSGAFRVEDRATGRTIADERYRWMVEGVEPGDFFAWWLRHYRGRLRFDFGDGGGIPPARAAGADRAAPAGDRLEASSGGDSYRYPD